MMGSANKPGVLSVVLLALLLACSPKTQNVRAFTASVEDTSDNLGAVLKLGYPSCIRAAEYQMLKKAIDALPAGREQDEADFARSLSICDQAKIVRTRALHAASTVTAFAAALEALANNRPIPHVPEVPSVDAGSDELVQATDDTVKTIASWVTANYRRKQLEKAVSESAQPIRAVLAALETTVSEVHSQTLEQEKKNLAELFRRYERASPPEPISSGLRGLELQRQLVDVNARIARAERLIARLRHLTAAHDRLVKAHGALNQEELLTEIRVAFADTFAGPPVPADPPALAIPRPLPDEAPTVTETPSSTQPAPQH